MVNVTIYIPYDWILWVIVFRITSSRSCVWLSYLHTHSYAVWVVRDWELAKGPMNACEITIKRIVETCWNPRNIGITHLSDSLFFRTNLRFHVSCGISACCSNDQAASAGMKQFFEELPSKMGGKAILNGSATSNPPRAVPCVGLLKSFQWSQLSNLWTSQIDLSMLGQHSKDFHKFPSDDPWHGYRKALHLTNNSHGFREKTSQKHLKESSKNNYIHLLHPQQFSLTCRIYLRIREHQGSSDFQKMYR